MDFSVSNNFNYQEMINAIDKIDKIKGNIIDHIEMSIDFYKKIKNNISITNKGNQLYEKFFAIPIEIKEDMQENYKIVYDNGEVEYGI